jgi:hypothetical protein
MQVFAVLRLAGDTPGGLPAYTRPHKYGYSYLTISTGFATKHPYWTQTKVCSFNTAFCPII